MQKNIIISETGLKDTDVSNIRLCISKISVISQVIIYGSRAKGNYKNGSDIDLCLKGNNLSTNTVFQLDEKLEALNLPYTFDISVYDKIDNPNFKEHIDRVGKVFYP
ncbi:MAG: nucleotidyltransferase domain-containing protein [Bdellovibrionaceae bacterium]|jgi:uncharacterized protein|nr:nucleotidyltransferase domain-containing protein [Pseudobdellovibrionaceae bacterium]